jgi:hypothetical protein
MHSQLKKNVTNNYSKGNPKAYPANIHKALTLMNECKPLKLDAVAVPAQGTAFVTKIMAWLGNPLGIPWNSAIIPIPDLLNSGIFIGILFFRL